MTVTDRKHDQILANYDRTLRKLVVSLLAYWKANADPTDPTRPILAAASSATAIAALTTPLDQATQDLVDQAGIAAASHPSMVKLDTNVLRLALVNQTGDMVRALRQQHQGLRTAIQQMLLEATVRHVELKEAGRLINARLAKPVSNARTLANTAIATMGRAAQELLHKQLKQANADPVMVYDGPRGGPIRDFCDRMVGKAFTLDQVRRMVNDSGTSVLYTMGGYNCRHSWTVIPRSTAARMGIPLGTDDDVAWSRDR